VASLRWVVAETTAPSVISLIGSFHSLNIPSIFRQNDIDARVMSPPRNVRGPAEASNLLGLTAIDPERPVGLEIARLLLRCVRRGCP